MIDFHAFWIDFHAFWIDFHAFGPHMGGPWAHIWALYKFPFPKQAPAGAFFLAKKLPFPKQAPAGAFFSAKKLPFPKQAPAGTQGVADSSAVVWSC